jgi:hypothetical protein
MMSIKALSERGPIVKLAAVKEKAGIMGPEERFKNVTSHISIQC